MADTYICKVSVQLHFIKTYGGSALVQGCSNTLANALVWSLRSCTNPFICYPYITPNTVYGCLRFLIVIKENSIEAVLYATSHHKNIEKHTVHTIVSWPDPKQWVIVHTSDLMMIIRQSIYILSIITKEMGKLKTHSLTYCIMDNWENMLKRTHTKTYFECHMKGVTFTLRCGIM